MGIEERIFNTGETNEDLRNLYNPEGSLLRRVQMRMLDMLLYVDKVCKEQGIEYSLEGGNVLGAVRHGGFIPWDDDVDIIMRRNEYSKFIRYVSEHPHPQYKLQSFYTDKGYMGTWVVMRDTKSEYIQDSPMHNIRKYKGVQVDIFPIEVGYLKFIHKIAGNIHHWNNKFFIGKHHSLARLYWRMEQYVCFPILRCFLSILGDKDYFTYELGHGHYPKFPMKSTFPLATVKFEGKVLPAPRNTDMYLTAIYKDYMSLPPKEKRNHHQAQYRIWD